jgi:predicted RNase H-like HicB family nuclease
MRTTKKTPRARRLTAAVTQEGKLYVAQCFEVDVASQGDSVEDALENLAEALALYFEDAPNAPLSATPIIAPVEVAVG